MKIQYYTGLVLMVWGLSTVFDRKLKGKILAEPNFLMGYYTWKYNFPSSPLSSAFVMDEKTQSVS